MKNRIVKILTPCFVFGAIICATPSFAQNDEPETEETETPATESPDTPETTTPNATPTNDRLARIEKYLKTIDDRIKSSDESTEVVGKFVLFSTEVELYSDENSDKKDSKNKRNSEKDTETSDKPNEKKKETIKIDQVKMSIKDGAIIDMQVITDDDRTFTNFFAPLSINLFNEKGYSLTYLNRQGHIDRLFVNRFIRWEREHGFSPKDEAIVLDADNTEASLERGVGINHVIDLSLFTDLPGLFGDKPNGITQIEAFTKVITNTTPLSYRNKSKPYKKLIPWIPIKFVTLRANYARFDEKFSTTVLDETFSRQVLLQRSHLNFDLTVNLFSRWLLKKSPHWFNVNTGGGVFSSNLATGEDTVNVLLPYFFFEPTFELKTVQNFGIDFSFRFLRQQAPQLEEHDGWRWIFRPQATLYWSSPDNASSKIFARAIFFNDLKDQENPFFQFQIGYAIRLSQFIGARGKIEDIKDEEN